MDEVEAITTPEVDTNGYGSMEDDAQSQLVMTIAMQQKQIDSLSSKLDAVTKRLDTLESAQTTASSRGAPLKAFPSQRPPTASRRQTLDPRQMRTSSSGDSVDKAKRSTASAPLSRRFQSKERLPSREVKEEAGTYRMYLQGRPVTFRLPEGYEQPANPEPSPAPDQKLQLDWVYGYRGKDCRNNLLLLGSGEIVYFTAAVCVIYNLDSNSQRHYVEHTDDIKCIAVHPDKVTIASGQVAGHVRPGKGGKNGSKAAATDTSYTPHVRIWNSETLETLKVIGAGVIDRAVACVSFSVTDGGQLLCAVDEHNDHRMSVWDWNKGARGTKLAEMKASQDPVYQAEFHPTEANHIVCCGKNQLSFWTYAGPKNLTKKMALFEKHDKPKFVTCFTFGPEGQVVTGDSNGTILFWNKGSNKIASSIPSAHEGVIFSVAMSEDGFLMSGGGKDKLIKRWNLEDKTELSSETLSDELGSCRTVLHKGNAYIVGTTRNCIITGESLTSPIVITEGHFGEMWGLTDQASLNQVITCAYDNHIRLWDLAARKALWDIELTEPLHCVALNRSGELLVVGARTPNWYLYNCGTQQQLTKGSCGNEQLECCQFSPDGSHVAFGSRDNNIYVYRLDGETMKLTGKCQGHTSFITHIDWSTDSGFIRSNSGDYELLYWEASSGKQFTDGEKIRDLEFDTQNCVLSLNTVGIWPSGADGTDINGCGVSRDRKLVASADDFGKVKLYGYPSRTPTANAHVYGGHSSHVTSVAFTSSGQHLVSAGGKDSTLLQWNIV
ncbi:echinoderm microtubule-associated protein-like 2 isoform X2 [Watersipora subatra]|uniref:echinoderm microtubule-associated protein-like 2 isoform X2 n=1 Tax=Watersipora subatra TaxID=2589382 RepID=UPI00355AF717